MRALGPIAVAALLACAGEPGPGPDAPDTDPPAARGDSGGPERPAPRTLAELIAAYEAGELLSDELALALAGVPASEDLPPAVSGHVLLAPGSSHTIHGPVLVPAGAVLVVGPGAVLQFDAGAGIAVEGRLYAIGTEDAPVSFRGMGDGAWSGVVVRGGPTELLRARLRDATTLLSVLGTGAPVRLVGCGFERWVDHALFFEDADGLRVAGGTFGLDPEPGLEHGEMLLGRRSAAVVEGATFGRMTGYRDVMDIEECKGGHTPTVSRCTFLGGEDDAIDLDDCDALVAGNVITGFWPPEGSQTQGVNGGGITGDRTSEPVLVGNVITGCYHAVGFKNGARPTLLNNTIAGNFIGVTLYTGDPSRPRPHGVLHNNIVWGNAARNGTPQDLVLNGKWWPVYNQLDDVQGTVEGTHNLLGVPLDGEQNLTDDPLLLPAGAIPIPSAGSPALDSGLSSGLPTGPLPPERVFEALAADVLGTARPQAAGGFVAIDRGAVEAKP